MLDYNKARLLLDFELPSGNIFQGPLKILNVPRCGTAPAQGFIISDSPVTLSTLQRTELIAKFEAAGYSNARAVAFADSFVTPSTLQVGLINGEKAVSVSRARDEQAIGAATLPHQDDKWVMYEALELAHLFDLNAYVTNASIPSLIDHPKITGRGWELVSPATVSGLPNDAFDKVFPNLFATSGGWPTQFVSVTSRAWFAANCRDYVYCAVPVGMHTGDYGAIRAAILLRRPRTFRDRNVALAYFRPQDNARSVFTPQSLLIGYSRGELLHFLSMKGAVISMAEGSGDAIEAFRDQPLSAPIYSEAVTGVMADWPNMLLEQSRYLQADADNFISKELFVYGWLDAPRSCNWTYSDIAVTAQDDVTVVTINPTSTLQNYADGQLRRFMTQLIDSGDYSGDDLAKLITSRDAVPDTWTTSIHALSRPQGYALTQNIEGLLPMAVLASDNDQDPREIELTAAPVITLGQIADKARAQLKMPALCFMPKGDQVTGIFGVEVVTFVGTPDGLGGTNITWSMTQFGQPLDATEEDMMVATSLNCQWVLVTCTESQVAAQFFNGAINRATANAWIDAEDIASYHDPVYRIDDYNCYANWHGWPAVENAEQAKLSVNQLIGDRANTSSMLFAMSAWSVGRRLRHSYVTFADFLAAETSKLSTTVYNPKLGWDQNTLTGGDYYDYGYSVRAFAGERVYFGSVPNGTAPKVCFELEAVDGKSGERIGVVRSTAKTVMAYDFKSWSGASDIGLADGVTPGSFTTGKFTFALDRSVPGEGRLRMYKNGIYYGSWAVNDTDIFYPAWFNSYDLTKYKLDIRPAFKPIGFENWDTNA